MLFAGFRTRSARCIRSDDKTPASNRACGREPSTREECKIKDCPSAYVGINQLIHNQLIDELITFKLRKEGRGGGRKKGRKKREREGRREEGRKGGREKGRKDRGFIQLYAIYTGRGRDGGRKGEGGTEGGWEEGREGGGDEGRGRKGVGRRRGGRTGEREGVGRREEGRKG